MERISKNYSRDENGKWYVHTEFGIVPAIVGSDLEELYTANRAELERVKKSLIAAHKYIYGYEPAGRYTIQELAECIEKALFNYYDKEQESKYNPQEK
jgi:hypothetical protein